MVLLVADEVPPVCTRGAPGLLEPMSGGPGLVLAGNLGGPSARSSAPMAGRHVYSIERTISYAASSGPFRIVTAAGHPWTQARPALRAAGACPSSLTEAGAGTGELTHIFRVAGASRNPASDAAERPRSPHSGGHGFDGCDPMYDPRRSLRVVALPVEQGRGAEREPLVSARAEPSRAGSPAVASWRVPRHFPEARPRRHPRERDTRGPHLRGRGGRGCGRAVCDRRRDGCWRGRAAAALWGPLAVRRHGRRRRLRRAEPGRTCSESRGGGLAASRTPSSSPPLPAATAAWCGRARSPRRRLHL